MDRAIESSNKVFTEDVTNYFDMFSRIALIEWLCFMAGMILIEILILFPFISKLKDEIWFTQSMINLIPTKLLFENKKLKENIIGRHNINALIVM